MEVNDVVAQEVLYKVTVVQEVLYMNYLSVRPLVLSNTLSHIWDRLNLPMLLLMMRNLQGRYPSSTPPQQVQPRFF